MTMVRLITYIYPRTSPRRKRIPLYENYMKPNAGGKLYQWQHKMYAPLSGLLFFLRKKEKSKH